MRDTSGQPLLLLDDFKRRTSDLYGVVRWWAIGPTQYVFWSVCVVTVILVLVAVAHFRVRPPGNLTATVQGPHAPPVQIVWGKVFRADDHGWKRARVLRARQVAEIRSRRGVLRLGDASTVRLRQHSQFRWSQSEPGHLVVTLARGCAWVQLSPLDELLVAFPDGKCRVAPGSVVEFNIKMQPKRLTWIYVRKGSARVVLIRQIKGTTERSSQGGQRVSRVLHRRFAYQVKEGKATLVGPRRWQPGRPPVDSPWRQWNLRWSSVEELRALPRETPKTGHAARAGGKP